MLLMGDRERLQDHGFAGRRVERFCDSLIRLKAGGVDSSESAVFLF